MLPVSRGVGRRLALLTFSLGLGACLFPEYTFNESSGGAGGKASTSTSKASSADASSSSGMGGTGGMPPPTEDCFNAMDDDGDMLADCEDPDCVDDTECVEPIPNGWGTFGYVVLGEMGTAPACPAFASAVKYNGFKDLSNTGFSCSNCGCSAPMNRSCELKTDLDPVAPGLQLFQLRNVACSNMNATNLITLTDPNPWNLSCDATNSSPGGASCAGSACNSSVFTQSPTVTGGSCNATGGVLNKASPTWQTASTACGAIPALVGCDSGKKCMPKPKAPYFGHVCVGKAGEQATCPAPFNDKHVYYKNFVDDRSCTACHCEDPSGGSCGIALTLYTDAACSSSVVTFNAGSCQDLTGNPTISGRTGVVNVAPTGGGCAPTSVTSAKLGDVVPTANSATTFCCL
ncbi:MAG: hypothetical protein U0414_32185 [Polyangiaceae bacterium]